MAPVEMPVPERLTDWGLPVALSVMARAAERLPAAAGVNLTPMVQLAPAATVVPQLLLWAKSAALVPKTAMLEIFNAELPELLRVTA